MINLMPYTPIAHKPLAQKPLAPKPLAPNRQPAFTNNSQNTETRETRIQNKNLEAQESFQQALDEKDPLLAKKGLIKAIQSKKTASTYVLGDIPRNDRFIHEQNTIGEYPFEDFKNIETKDELKEISELVSEFINDAPTREMKAGIASVTAIIFKEKGKELSKDEKKLSEENFKLPKDILIEAYKFQDIAYKHLAEERQEHKQS